MDKSTPAQLRRELDIALDGVTKLADRLTKTIERVNTIFDNDINLEFRIESARSEAFILAKVVANMLARECLHDPNPRARLDVLLKQYYLAADVFTPDPDSDTNDAELRKLGVDIPKPTTEALQQRERDAAIAASYRDIANALRDEAMKAISAVQKR
jgi:hypothetical protein